MIHPSVLPRAISSRMSEGRPLKPDSTTVTRVPSGVSASENSTRVLGTSSRGIDWCDLVGRQGGGVSQPVCDLIGRGDRLPQTLARHGYEELRRDGVMYGIGHVPCPYR